MTLKWNPRRSYIEWMHYMYIFCILYLSYFFSYSNYIIDWGYFERILLQLMNYQHCQGEMHWCMSVLWWAFCLKEWLIFLRNAHFFRGSQLVSFWQCFNYSIVRNSDWVIKYKELVSTWGLKYFINNKLMTWRNDSENMTYIMDIFGQYMIEFDCFVLFCLKWS